MSDAPTEWSLVRQSGANTGPARCELPYGVRLIAGRALDAPIRLTEDDNAASRYHAAFEASTAGVHVMDLNSRNGVYVNDARQQIAWLRGGDVVRLGNTTFRIEHRPNKQVVAADPTGDHAPFQLVPTWGSSTATAHPYRCTLCGRSGPVPAIDHEPWWLTAEWLCPPCADTRRTPPETWPLQVPSQVGDFELLRFLARGGMGLVFEARHIRGGMRAAVKLMSPSRGTFDPAMTKRFVKEQRIAARLKHDRIVRCFGVGTTEGGVLFVATEFLSHGDASALSSPTSNVRTVVAITADVCDALAYAHGQGVVHRDVKPANVLLAGPEGDLWRGKLTDFGLAKSFRDMGGSVLTKPGEVGGSVAFLAPEQLLGFRDVGPGADVYGTAAMLYYMLTGEVPVALRVPAKDATDAMLCLAALADERVPIQQRRADVHPWLAQWIDLLVCRDHTKRAHIDAATVATTLWGFLAANP